MGSGHYHKGLFRCDSGGQGLRDHVPDCPIVFPEMLPDRGTNGLASRAEETNLLHAVARGNVPALPSSLYPQVIMVPLNVYL